MHKRVTKFVAFLLLLVFLQKTCGLLWLHNWLHTNSKAIHTTVKGKTISQEQIKCSCLDDFFLPYIEPEPALIITHLPAYSVYSEEKFIHALPSLKLFFSLRAPPFA
jgi:hypothetical protein